MTVKELIERLQNEDPDRIIICQKDSEGNGYSPLSDMWTAGYKATSTWDGEVGMEKLTDEERKIGFTDEDVIKDGVPALVLVPVN